MLAIQNVSIPTFHEMSMNNELQTKTCGGIDQSTSFINTIYGYKDL